MRIEDIDKAKLSKTTDKELLILKLRFTQVFDKSFKDNDAAVVGSLNRNKFLKRYRMLLDEMNSRKLEHSTSAIDKAAFRKAMAIHKFGIDVTDFEDVVIAPNCIVIDADSSEQKIDLEKVESIVQQTHSELSELIKKRSEIENTYIPLYDLVLRAKQETVKVEIQKPYPNEHSARLQSPDMVHIRVRRTNGGKVQGVNVPSSIAVVWYVALKEGKEVPIPQALRFPIKSWTAAKAKKWLADNDITSIKFESAIKAAKKFWSKKYINDLPDSAFLYIVTDSKKDSESKSKDIRYFPYRNSDSSIDVTHLKKAIVDISKSDLPKDIQDGLITKANKLLEDMKEGKKFEKFISVFPIEKAGDEHIVCGIVYEPDVEDSQGDKASEEEIRKAAYQFMEEVQIFKVEHEGKKVKVKVLESYVAPADFTIAKQPVKKGSWVLTTRVLDKKLWEAVKSGEITGFSMSGYATTSTAA